MQAERAGPQVLQPCAMRAMVITESLTGNTRRAGEQIASNLAGVGIDITATCSTREVDHGALQASDLVVIGTWVHGLFVVGMSPWGIGRLRDLPAMRGKQVAVFCTFAINPGSTLERMSTIASQLGGTSVGGMAIRRTRIAAGTEDFTSRLVTVLR
jgi:hypothetical protein